MPYQVERHPPLAVRATVERLWADNLQLESHPADKFAWLYLEAPLPPTAVFVLAADGAAVGTAGVGVRQFQVAGASVRAGLLADLAVDRAHRSVGPALALVRAGKAFVDTEFALAYGFPNKLAEGVFKRAGYTPLGTIGRYARPLRHGAFVDRVDDHALARVPARLRPIAARVIAAPAAARAAAIALDVARLGQDAPSAARAARGWQLATATHPDRQHDDLWSAARGDYGVVGERTAGFLAWRFPPRPERTWWRLTRRGERALAAYAVVDVVDGAAHVRDLFGHRDAVVALLDRLPFTLYRGGAVSASMRYLGAAWVTAALAARGFEARASQRLIAVTVGASCPAAGRSQVTDAAAWHLTDADEDV